MEVTRRTDLSPDCLWAVMSDVREWPQWLDTMNDLDPLEPERPEEVGAAYRLDQTGFPTATWTITERPRARVSRSAGSPWCCWRSARSSGRPC